MEQNYDVLLDGKAVGKVQVSRRGLYDHYSCRCRLPDREVCRLYVRCGGREENLGVLIPEEECFCLETSIPAKRLGEGERTFHVVPKSRKEPQQAAFLPIRPDQPFAFIEQLKDACLAVQDGQPGALVPQPILPGDADAP